MQRVCLFSVAMGKTLFQYKLVSTATAKKGKVTKSCSGWNKAGEIASEKLSKALNVALKVHDDMVAQPKDAKKPSLGKRPGEEAYEIMVSLAPMITYKWCVQLRFPSITATRKAVVLIRFL